MKKMLCMFIVLLSSLSIIAQTEIDKAWESYKDKDYSTVIKICDKLVRLGDNEARCLLYFAYDKQGKGKQAVHYVLKAAENGLPRATYLMGYMYDKGDNVERDKSKAEYWYEKCISSNSEKDKYALFSMVNLSLIYIADGRKADAKPLLEKAFANGDKGIAPRLLATIYYKGKDEGRAIGLYRIAAENGDDYAQCKMGEYFMEGKYVEKDYGEAAKWYLLAAEQGNWQAQENLGSCFEMKYRKTLDERDLKQCLKWYYIPRKNQHIISLGSIDNLEFTKDGGAIVKNVDEASPLKKFYDEGCLGAKKYKNFREWEDSVVAKLAVDSDVDVNIPSLGKKNRGILVLIIANENYQYEQFVPYAENDGQIFRKYCQSTLGVPQKNIKLVTDASLNEMRRGFDWLKENTTAQKPEKIIFYYSGHGAPDENLTTSYLLPVDGYATNKATGMDLKSVYDILSSMKTETIVILDACFSGTNKKGEIMEKSKGVIIKARSPQPQGQIIVMSACKGGETAHTYEDQKHSIFTYYLLKQLQKNRGSITLGALYETVKQQVVKNSVSINGKLQTPDINISPSLRDIWKVKTFY